RRPLCVANTRFYFAFAIRVLHSAWKRCDAVVLQHVTVQRIERGLINVGREHAFAQIIEHHYTSDSAQSAKSFLMQLSPNTRTGTEHQKANSFSAISQRQNEQAGTPVLASLGVAHHRAGSIIDLRFFTRRGLNDHARLRRGRSAQLPHEALDASVFFAEAVAVHQVLPNGHGVPTFGQLSFYELPVRFAGALRRS